MKKIFAENATGVAMPNFKKNNNYILLISSLFSAIYIVRIIANIYSKPVKNDIELENIEHRLPLMMMISVLLCALGIISFIFLNKFLNMFLVFI